MKKEAEIVQRNVVSIENMVGGHFPKFDIITKIAVFHSKSPIRLSSTSFQPGGNPIKLI